MARINVKELESKISQSERELNIIKSQIENLPLEERLEHAEFYKALDADTRKQNAKRRAKIQRQNRKDNVVFAWTLAKYIVGAIIVAVGFWAFTSLAVIFS